MSSSPNKIFLIWYLIVRLWFILFFPNFKEHIFKRCNRDTVATDAKFIKTCVKFSEKVTKISRVFRQYFKNNLCCTLGCYLDIRTQVIP